MWIALSSSLTICSRRLYLLSIVLVGTVGYLMALTPIAKTSISESLLTVAFHDAVL